MGQSLGHLSSLHVLKPDGLASLLFQVTEFDFPHTHLSQTIVHKPNKCFHLFFFFFWLTLMHDHESVAGHYLFKLEISKLQVRSCVCIHTVLHNTDTSCRCGTTQKVDKYFINQILKIHVTSKLTSGFTITFWWNWEANWLTRSCSPFKKLEPLLLWELFSLVKEQLADEICVPCFVQLKWNIWNKFIF